MGGYDLPSGEYINKRLTNDEMWGALNWMFSDRVVNSSSYKFIMFKSIMDIVAEGRCNNYIISFETLFDYFIANAWELVLRYKVRQDKINRGETKLEQILVHFFENKLNGVYTEYTNIDKKNRDELIYTVMAPNACSRYVLGALYEDTNRFLYSFSKERKTMQINPRMARFLLDNKMMIYNLNYYKWATFYEKINGEACKNKLKSVIDASYRRDGESIYRTLLAQIFEREKNEVTNTLELFFETPDVVSNDDNISRGEFETNMFDDFDNMIVFLNDPVKLVKEMKKKRGLL